MTSVVIILSLFLLLKDSVFVSALYSFIGEDKRCFSIDRPRDIPIVFSYEILDDSHHIDFTMYYGASISPDLQILSKTLKKATGTIASAKHQTRFKINVNYGYSHEFYDKLAIDEKLDNLSLEVHKLNDIMAMTLVEADYHKHKEMDYHDETESMDSATLWWPMSQIGLLVITSVLMVHHLKGFFKRNKII